MKNGKQYLINNSEIKSLVEHNGYCIASDEITVAGKSVGYMYRELPDDSYDSGWRFFSGEESQEYVDNPDNFGVYDINTIANYDSTIIAYILSPVGSEYIRIGNRFVSTEK